MVSTRNPRFLSMAIKHMWGEVYEPLVNDQWPYNPHFVENSHERPFSIIPNANTYGFLTKKWSPPEIQECDLWQGNICVVRCTILWSIINGHTTPIIVENSHERLFSMTLKANAHVARGARNRPAPRPLEPEPHSPSLPPSFAHQQTPLSHLPLAARTPEHRRH
jgi:hypothetical protein